MEGQARQASAKAVRHYQKEIKNYLQTNNEKVDFQELKLFHKKLRAQCLDLIEKVILKNPKLISDSGKEKLRSGLSGQIADVWEQIKVKVSNDQERQAKESLAELYRERILQKTYTSDDLQAYFKDWQDLERSFFANNHSSRESRTSQTDSNTSLI